MTLLFESLLQSRERRAEERDVVGARNEWRPFFPCNDRFLFSRRRGAGGRAVTSYHVITSPSERGTDHSMEKKVFIYILYYHVITLCKSKNGNFKDLGHVCVSCYVRVLCALTACMDCMEASICKRDNRDSSRRFITVNTSHTTQ
jgi:hypothetical protein